MKTDRLAYYNHACTIFFAIWCMVNYMPSDLRSWAAARPILDMGRLFDQPNVGLIKKWNGSIDPDESTDIVNTIGRCRNQPSRPTTHIDRPVIVNTIGRSARMIDLVESTQVIDRTSFTINRPIKCEHSHA